MKIKNINLDKVCNSNSKKYTNYLHILTIIIALFGVFYQIYCLKNNYLTSPILPISITLVLSLRLPNQICIAHNEPNAWTSVIGTILSLISFIYLSILTYNYK